MKHIISGAVIGAAMALYAVAPAAAQPAPADLRALGDVLQMDKTLAIMQREASQNAQEIAPDLFGGAAPAQWGAAITALFDPATARAEFDKGLALGAANLSGAHLAEVMAFFQSPLGQRIVSLEVTTREALLDDTIEAAAQDVWADMQANPLPAQTQRAGLLQDIVTANDLIETNIAAALNGNFAFYQGLIDAGAVGGISADDMLADVWAAEPQVRADMQDWLFPFLAMAYAPLSDEDLQSYITFSQTAAGRALNGALFAAFDALGAVQSRGMGLAAGRLMAGQDI
jgi:hypothetical protein